MNKLIYALLSLAFMLSTGRSVYADNFAEACLSNFTQYDNLMRKRSQGQLSEADSISMVDNLRSALANFKEYRKDNENPISEEVAKAFGKHYNDFTVIGIFMFQSQDYKGAYDIWEACVDIPDDPMIASQISNMQNSRGQLAFNRAMAATQTGMKDEAMSSYEKAYQLGYNDNQLFDAAIMMAEQARDYSLAERWAQRGIEKAGNTSIYRDYQIKYAMMQDPAKGVELCTETIAIDPTNPKWLTRRIEANEKLQNHEAVLEDMAEIIKLKPNDPVSLYNYGAKKMFVTNNARANKTAGKEQLKEMYSDASSAFESALKAANGEKSSMPAVIKSLNALDKYYHETGDKAGKKRVEEYRKKLGLTK